MLPLLLAVLQTQTPQAVYNGRAGQIDVPPPRVATAHVTIDGVLDEPVWRRAALLTGFSQYEPVDGRPAVDSTEVLVWYGPNAIYFGIRAFEQHGQVHATLADRDHIDSDDYVQIVLDTFDDHRRAYVFGVNPLGVQADGIRSEGAMGAGGPGTGGGFDNVDMNPDYVYASKGVVTSWGYQVEMRIPFKTLRYQAADPQTWALQVFRRIQHSGYLDAWTPVVRASASVLAQSGSLEGLTALHRGLVLDINPFTTTHADGSPDSTGTGWNYKVTPALGGTVRWGITNNLNLDATINPDFSQVEADVSQVTVNERFAVYYPEKRPFFLEGIDQFNTPDQLIYTRRIVDPVAGAKLTGKIGRMNIGFISAVDGQSASLTGTKNPVFNILRVRDDIGGQSTLGVTYTDRIDGSDYNRVAAADARIVFAKLYYFETQAAASFTDSAGSKTTAPLWEATLDRTGRNWGFHYKITGIDSAFRARSGFVNRTGVIQPFIMNRLSFYGGPGALIENWTTFYTLNGTWDYNRFSLTRAPLEGSFSARSSVTFRGNWVLSLSPQWQTVAFDSGFYAGYAVAGPTDTVPFVVPPRLNNIVSGTIGLTTPQFTTFAASASVTYGRDVAYFEPAAAKSFSWRASVDWRPNGKLRVNAQYQYAILDRLRDGTRFSTARIPRLKIEYQLSRPIFFRFVGQYDAESRDSLRDPRTDQPIVYSNGAGGYTRAAAAVSNDLRVDWLFSYHPNPGTVVYFGYGSSLTEDNAFTFRNLQRVSDGFFIKLSYLFRV